MENINDLMTAFANYNLYKQLEKIAEVKDREIVFLCVGNDKYWFDSFGPIFGSVLQKLNIEKFIYGNTKCSIKACNLKQYVDMLYKFHQNPYVVVIDSALSSCDQESVKVKEGPITCAYLSDKSMSVGDLAITYNIPKKQIHNPDNYMKLIKNLKNVARILYFVLQAEKTQNMLDTMQR